MWSMWQAVYSVCELARRVKELGISGIQVANWSFPIWLSHIWSCFITRWDFASSRPPLVPQNINAQTLKNFLFCWVKFVFLPFMFEELAPKHSDATLGGPRFPSSFSVFNTRILKRQIPFRLRKVTWWVSASRIQVSCYKEVSSLRVFLGFPWGNSHWVAAWPLHTQAGFRRYRAPDLHGWVIRSHPWDKAS